MPPNQAIQLFRQTYKQDPTIITHAPGRVNLIGEHTDYNEGYVFPAAIDKGITVAARPNNLPHSRAISAQAGSAPPFSLNATPHSIEKWTKFPAGTAWALQASTNLDIAVDGDLPLASGVSSSAAIEMAFAVLWNHIENLNHSPQKLALLTQKAENQFVGVNCGIMDQMASALGKQDHALFLDTKTLETRYAPLPPQIAIVLCDTGASRELAASAYNQRRQECEQAAQQLNLPSLRTATLQQVNTLKDPTIQKRARHVVTENQRCLDFESALKSQNLPQLKSLMEGSHTSLKNDYEVCSLELDTMVNACQQAPGYIAARMTGAGFGGCCVALAHKSNAKEFAKNVEHLFKQHVKHTEPKIIICQASIGAHIVKAQEAI